MTLTSVQEAEWQMLKAAYREAFKDALRKARESWEEGSAPCIRAFLPHPILGGVAVEIAWEGFQEPRERLEEGGVSRRLGSREVAESAPLSEENE